MEDTKKELATIPMEEYKRLKEVDKSYIELHEKQVFHVQLTTKFMDFYTTSFKDKQKEQFQFTDWGTVAKSEKLQKVFGEHMEEVQAFIDESNQIIDMKLQNIEADHMVKNEKLQQKLDKIPNWIKEIFK